MFIVYDQLLAEQEEDENILIRNGMFALFVCAGLVDGMHSRLAKSLFGWDVPVLRTRWNRMCDFGSDLIVAVFCFVAYFLFWLNE